MFGEYAPQVRLHPRIWLGIKIDAPEDPDVCIKMITVAELDQRDTEDSEKLLLSAAIQQAIAQQSGRWVPVLHLGSGGVDTFYITPRYSRSLQTLIDQRVTIDAGQLRIIMLEILEGLIDLQCTYQQAHGNLKPSNVFLSSPAGIVEQCIRLGDPDGTADTLPVITRSYDLKAMGQILYSLVTFKPYVTAHFPLTNLRPWKRLGTSGKRWFALCNQLLQSPPRPDMPMLLAMRTQITALKIPRRRFSMSAFFF